MKKILVVGMTENPGGLESVLKNYQDHINHELLQFDYLCNTYEKVAYEDELTELGSNFYHIFPRSKNPFKFKKELNHFFKNNSNKYDTIWVNLNTLTNIDYLKIAKKYQIKRRIVHSHNSKHKDKFLRIMLHYYNRHQISKYATDFWACEEAAADWFFTKDSRKKALIIPNAILVENYKFSKDKRHSIRQSLGWNNNFIIGHVGRFHEQKNHPFIIKIFKDFYKNHNDARLVLIGDGNDRSKIEDLVKIEDLTKVVKFAGKQSNVNEWLNAFDVFLFPSLYEGLSIAALEAQANGLPMITNERIIPEALEINENLIMLKLDDNTKEWIEKLEEIDKGKVFRDNSNMVDKFKRFGFDIKTESKKLQENLLRGD